MDSPHPIPPNEEPKSPPSFYRDRIIDAPLYHLMKDIFESLVIELRLKESLNNFHSQANEAMNQVVAKYAPS